MTGVLTAVFCIALIALVGGVVISNAPPGPERRFAVWSGAVIAVIVACYGVLSSWLKEAPPILSWIPTGFYLVAFLFIFTYLRKKEREAEEAGRKEREAQAAGRGDDDRSG